MTTKISLHQIREDAEELYRQGGFYCSEALVASVKKNIAPEIPDALIAAASGFPRGVGCSGCICGAVSGAVLCLGYFFGRTKPSTPNDPASLKTLKLANELQENFRNNHMGVLCCHVYTKGMDMAAGEHKNQCISFTGEMAVKTAEIVARELGLKLTD